MCPHEWQSIVIISIWGRTCVSYSRPEYRCQPSKCLPWIDHKMKIWDVPGISGIQQCGIHSYHMGSERVVDHRPFLPAIAELLGPFMPWKATIERPNLYFGMDIAKTETLRLFLLPCLHTCLIHIKMSPAFLGMPAWSDFILSYIPTLCSTMRIHPF